MIRMNRLALCILIVVGLEGGSPAATLADQVLPWLPADIEVLVVSNVPFFVGEHGVTGLASYSQLAGAGWVADQNGGALARAIVATRADAGLYAARRFHIVEGGIDVGSYGTMSGCSVLRLHRSDSSNQVARLFRALQADPSDGDRIAVVASGPRSSIATTPRVYISMPDPRLLVSCSDRGLLSEILSRRRRRAAREALPQTLPEWHSVDQTAAVWGLRHYSEVSPDPTSPRDPHSDLGREPSAVGMTLCVFSDALVEVRHITRDARSTELYARLWQTGDSIISSPAPGVVSVRYDPRKDSAGTRRFNVTCWLLGKAAAV